MQLFEKKLRQTIDEQVQIRPWKESDKIPLYFLEFYKMYEITLLGVTFLLANEVGSPAGTNALKKHAMRLCALADLPVAFLFKSLSRYRMQSMLSNRIPFMLEDAQMFLPFLGINVKQPKEFVQRVEKSKFSPSTQLAYLYFLYRENVEMNATRLAKELNFTTMTASRALQHLYEVELLQCRVSGKTGRSKEYRKIDGPLFFKRGKEFLCSPVKQIVNVRHLPDTSLLAGLEALAQLTMINGPEYSIRAIGQNQFSNMQEAIVRDEAMVKDMKLAELQIWAYDPLLFSVNGHVDPLSLYLSLMDLKDERVDMALEDMLRRQRWYTD